MSKADIHPQMNEVTFKCSCGASYSTLSSLDTSDPSLLALEVCSNCHPFYTGKQKLVDTAGRVDRFKRMYGARGASVVETNSKSGQ